MPLGPKLRSSWALPPGLLCFHFVSAPLSLTCPRARCGAGTGDCVAEQCPETESDLVTTVPGVSRPVPAQRFTLGPVDVQGCVRTRCSLSLPSLAPAHV